MKKWKWFASVLLLCLICFRMFQVQAEEGVSDEITIRLMKAKQLGLEDYVDEEGYLTDRFYEGKSDQELSELGVDGLVKMLSEEELDAYVSSLRAGIGFYTVTRYEKVSQINPSTGNYLYTGVFEVDGKLAYCIERSMATPAKGSPTGSWVAVTNDNLRKVLYYGYNGPAHKGYTYVETALAAGEANGDGDNSLGRRVLAEIKKYSSPPSSFKVWKVETNGGSTQDLAFYTIEEKGYVQLKKVSGNPELTVGNNNYSLAGAIYGVYSNSACTAEVGRLTTDEAGITGMLAVAPGTYYVKEISSPPGYLLSTNVQTFTVSSAQTTTVTMSDEPEIVIPEAMIQKEDAKTGESVPQVNGTFKNAQFLVKFYCGDYKEGINPETQDVEPDKQWIFTTDAKGMICLHTDYLVSGDTLWTNKSGQYVLPLGTITIQEIQPPEGYYLNPQVFVQKLQTGINTFSTVLVPETAIEVRLIIKKVNSKEQLLAGAEFTIYSDKECTQEVIKGTTEEDGIFKVTNLKTKTYYYIKETKAPDGYVINSHIYEIYTDGLEENQEIYLEIINEMENKLPDTGSSGIYVWSIMGCFWCMASFMQKKRRRKFMIKKFMKWFCMIALLIVTVTGQTHHLSLVKAAGSGIMTNQGVAAFSKGDAQIEIKGNDGQSLVGKKLYLYRLFDAENAAGLESIDYTINEEYAQAMKTVVGNRLNKNAEEVTEYEVIDYMQSLNSYVVEGAQTEQTLESSYSDYRYFVEELLAEFHAEGLRGTLIIVKDTKLDNSIEISGLAHGYYMIEDLTAANGEHTAVSLTMLNTANSEASVHIKADYPTVIKKIQEDDNQEEIGLEGWNDIGDFEIGQDVPYRYQSNIPNMNGYDTYYYAWHDVMDEALTLKRDSIQITITGTIDSVEKVYRLTQEEYNLITDLENETFVIEVEDMKAIVDREFDQINERKENIYGQSVNVTYKATLNENAISNTGRPGFENDVRLEFSNNPNSTGKGQTGYTPWDTVVCFTYQINGVKVNNYGTELEGAVFRLYYDKECENEVYVRKVSDGYSVIHADSWGEGVPEETVAITSDVDGLFNIYGLDGGVYYLKEVSAPAGYRPLLDPIEIQVTPVFPTERNSYIKGEGAGEQVLDLTASAHIIAFTNGSNTEEEVALGTDVENGSMNLSVVNEAGKKLPITGSYLMPILIAVGIFLMCLSMKKGRKKHE